MPRDLNTVKTSPASDAGAVLRKGDQYHHGALRAALLTAAEAIIGERGIDGFSLREAARRAGVSPAAPQHHFGDARGLLTALATAGFAQLADALAAADAAAGPDREARTRAQATAYVAFALVAPARFDVMWRRARIDRDDPAYQVESRRAFRVLTAAVAGVPLADAPPAPPDRADPRAVACWALVHGFARLALDGAFGLGDAAVEHAAAALLAPVLACLRV